jgi:hypothetical protein
MPNTILTKNGLDFVTSAGGAGPFIAIKYCVPVYDHRLDYNIHTLSPDLPITYDSTISTTSAATQPTGEMIWYTNGNADYSLSQSVILSGGTFSTSGSNLAITNYLQSSVGIGANLYKSVPLSPSVSGAALYPPTLNQNGWLISTSGVNAGNNTIDPLDRTKYWPVVDYYPVVDNLGNVRGAFKAHLSQSVGRFKFNKIAFYAVQMNGNTEVLSTPPCFFAEAYVKEVAVKSNISSEGFDDFVVDAQIDLTALNSSGTSGFYTTSGDYWSRTVGGLYSPDPVGIGSFAGSVSQPQAVLHVRASESVPRHDKLVRWDASGTDGDTKYQTWSVGNDGELTLSASSATNKTFTIRETTSTQNIIPITTSTYNLGASNKYWKEGYIDSLSATSIVSNSIDVANISADTTYTSLLKANTSVNPNIYVDDNLIRNADKDINIGAQTRPFNKIYCNDIYLSGATDEYVVGRYADISSVVDNNTKINDNLVASDVTVNVAKYNRIGDMINLEIDIMVDTVDITTASHIYISLPPACDGKYISVGMFQSCVNYNIASGKYQIVTSRIYGGSSSKIRIDAPNGVGSFLDDGDVSSFSIRMSYEAI